MTLRAIFLILVTLTFAVAPFVTPPFTGYDPGRFPVQIPEPAVQPAGYAFSIWSVIYVWLILHAAYGYWKRAHSMDWDEVRVPLIVSLLIGTVWLAIAGSFPLLATLAILFMLATAMVAFLQADEFYDRWMLSAPLAVYAGWLSAASAVSVGVLLGGYGVLSDSESAIVMMAVVLVIAGVVQWLRPYMPLYGLTVVWALIGIMVANAGSSVFVALIAAAAAAAMAALTFYTWHKRRVTV
ncbi:hypothetical protein [Pseudotabrizicola sp. 4114]|uniref:hypothetical protein n=1 Tax=Pseudotabrizicola sp. 4114 TaxID=2817731 RepID=UPI002860D6E1|nr:hypothetical protein [Pseudorhodobacter sp. 4114]